MERIIADDMHILKGFTNIYTIVNYLISYDESQRWEKFRSIFKFINLKFTPHLFIAFDSSVCTKARWIINFHVMPNVF